MDNWLLSGALIVLVVAFHAWREAQHRKRKGPQ